LDKSGIRFDSDTAKFSFSDKVENEWYIMDEKIVNARYQRTDIVRNTDRDKPT